MTKKVIYIFTITFVLNFVWEHLQSGFYEQYNGSTITGGVLTNLALFHAALITLIYYVFEKTKWLKHKWWLLTIAVLVIAVILEIGGLRNGKFEYTESMPTFTGYEIGILPVLGLVFISYLSAVFTKKLARSSPKKSDDDSSSSSRRRRSYYYDRDYRYRR